MYINAIYANCIYISYSDCEYNIVISMNKPKDSSVIMHSDIEKCNHLDAYYTYIYY